MVLSWAKRWQSYLLVMERKCILATKIRSSVKESKKPLRHDFVVWCLVRENLVSAHAVIVPGGFPMFGSTTVQKIISPSACRQNGAPDALLLQ